MDQLRIDASPADMRLGERMLQILIDEIHALHNATVVSLRDVSTRFDGEMERRRSCAKAIMPAGTKCGDKLQYERRLHEWFATGECDAAIGHGEEVSVHKQLVHKRIHFPVGAANELFAVLATANHTYTWILPFRIMAPRASERTTLEEHRCARAGSVMEREFSYLEYASKHGAYFTTIASNFASK